MKKILFVIILQFLCISHLYANDSFLDEFNEWLSKNGHYDYLNDPNGVIPKVCKEEKRYSNLWYYNKCDEIKSGNNLDINLICEQPKISKHRDKIINSLSNLLDLNKELINLKGKTTEKLGLIGKEKAIACEVICSISK